tara:strand:- start:23 stop:310 length:288 start_codon:yes stop_codon:yes gene_type:complete
VEIVTFLDEENPDKNLIVIVLPSSAEVTAGSFSKYVPELPGAVTNTYPSTTAVPKLVCAELVLLGVMVAPAAPVIVLVIAGVAIVGEVRVLLVRV